MLCASVLEINASYLGTRKPEPIYRLLGLLFWLYFQHENLDLNPQPGLAPLILNEFGWFRVIWINSWNTHQADWLTAAADPSHKGWWIFAGKFTGGIWYEVSAEPILQRERLANSIFQETNVKENVLMYGKLLSDSTVTSGSALFAIAGTSLCEDQELLGKHVQIKVEMWLSLKQKRALHCPYIYIKKTIVKRIILIVICSQVSTQNVKNKSHKIT